MAKASSLLPLIILFVVIGVLAFIGYQIYLWSNELADRGSKHMEKKNMKFTKDGGLRVSVKDQGDEKLGDKTQKYATFPQNSIFALANTRQCSRQRLE